MEKLLVSAFEPFGGDEINPTMEIVKALPEEIEGVPVRTLVLPVVFEKAAEALIEEIEREQATIVVSLGLAGGRDAITPERVGVNVMDARIPDASGFQPVDEPICKEGPAAYFSALPIRKMMECVRELNIPARISNTAGTYVCNDLMYRLLAYREKHPELVCGFVHVPYCMEMKKDGAPVLALSEEIRAVTRMCEVIVKEKQQR